MHTDQLQFRPLDAPIGAMVEGFKPDLAGAENTAVPKALASGLATYGVLVFRDQEIDAAGFVALGRAFGDLEILPEPGKRHPDHPEIFNLSNLGPEGEVVAYDDPQSVFLRGTERWHTDSSFREVPCLCTMLYAVEVPQSGGQTEFANMFAAYESLSPAERQEFASIRLVHDYVYSRDNNPGEMDPMSEAERAKYPAVAHPLVRTHADGRKSLYMGGHVSHIEGQTGAAQEQGRAQMAELTERATSPDFVYTHTWAPGDLVVWDNRSTLHRLRPYDIAHDRRVMQRITVAGTDPVR